MCRDESTAVLSPKQFQSFPMIDQIHIRDLLVRGILGINDEERTNRQDILLNVTLSVDTRSAAGSDAIEDAVNYRTLTKQIIDHVESSACLLVERLAEEVARLCLHDPRVEAVEVTIDKPGALRFARSVGITIFRTRDDVMSDASSPETDPS